MWWLLVVFCILIWCCFWVFVRKVSIGFLCMSLWMKGVFWIGIFFLWILVFWLMFRYVVLLCWELCGGLYICMRFVIYFMVMWSWRILWWIGIIIFGWWILVLGFWWVEIIGLVWLLCVIYIVIWCLSGLSFSLLWRKWMFIVLGWWFWSLLVVGGVWSKVLVWRSFFFLFGDFYYFVMMRMIWIVFLCLWICV